MLVKKRGGAPSTAEAVKKKQEGLLQGARQPTNNREKRPTGPQQTKPAAGEIHVSDDESTKKNPTRPKLPRAPRRGPRPHPHPHPTHNHPMSFSDFDLFHQVNITAPSPLHYDRE
ncbi:hypothetical protein CCHR01_04063 [Colletotrichum chrysophilum]|uniref:Uncharacterized protein n=1 Tax=Colletotrichum chrysophilum TaxID=1836956 RepID=A0AAD9AU57_9PEZI|nr:hypothetical protein CCHR01_04063 [Colletotrichum chrysophilum]